MMHCNPAHLDFLFFIFIVKHVYLGWLIVKLSYLHTVYVHLQLLAVLSN